MYADSATSFEQSYRRIAQVVKLPGHDDPQADILLTVSQWLENEGSDRWLMILDNFDDVDIFYRQSKFGAPQAGNNTQTRKLSSYLPRHAQASILITTRSTGAAFRLTGRYDSIINVGGMDRDESMSLLAKKLTFDKSKDEDRSHLVHALGYLPLAITQAAAYIAIKAPAITISKYVEHFSRGSDTQMALLSKDAGDLRRHPDVPNSLLLTWRISFDQIRKQDLQASELLSLISLLNPERIPRFLLCRGNDEGLKFDDAIGTLLEFSMVRADMSEDSFSTHRLIQLSTRQWLESRGELESRQREAMLTVMAAFPEDISTHLTTCDIIEPHGEALLQYNYATNLCQLVQAGLLYKMACCALVRGKYKSAEGRITKAIRIRESLLGQADLSTISCVDLKGAVLSDMGHYAEAEEMHHISLEVRTKMLGKEHPDTLVSVSNLALVLRYQGKYEQAEQMDQRALAEREKVLGVDHPDTLTSVSNLASILQYQGKYEQAEEMSRRALAGREKVLGVDHPDTLTSVYCLADLFDAKQDRHQALKLYHRAVNGYTKVLGPAHPTTQVCQRDKRVLSDKMYTL